MLGTGLHTNEPRKFAGTRGYFAVAGVERITPDSGAADMYFAIIEPGSYLAFANPLSSTNAQGIVIENGVLNEAGQVKKTGSSICGRRLRGIKSHLSRNRF